MDAVKKGLDKALYWITVVLFALLVVIVVWQIFSRQVLSTPATWTDEGARLTFVWLGLFASAFVFGERGHIAVEYVARKLPVRGEQVVAILVQVIVLAFAVVVLVWGGWRASQNAWNQELSALPFTFGQMYLALPISGILMAFYSLFYIQGLARGVIAPYANNSDEDDPDLQMAKYTDQSLVLPDADDQTSPSAASPEGPTDTGKEA
ncbi:TRAP transporter small permease [Georgenia sp. MJ170]|uniref:TRAP transporter small permease n=1 Tax=Georgenia sunbinii TaxID=3117728 RepID=UPI002F264D0D